MRNIILRLAFVGTDYTGWQHQKNGLSVQEVIETAISKITGEKITLVGCSRTDAGVHAEDYVANFRTASSIPADKFQPAIQSKLPRDIQIVKSGEAPSTFDARRSSYQKTYRYQIYFGSSPFCLNRWWQFGGDLDQSLLPDLATLIKGTHDFSGFCVRKSLKADNTCTIKDAAWRGSGKRLYFRVTGDRFLHHMVRFLVGAQMEVATGRLTDADFEMMLRHPDRKRALYPAPAEGLYLMKVKFD